MGNRKDIELSETTRHHNSFYFNISMQVSITYQISEIEMFRVCSHCTVLAFRLSACIIKIMRRTITIIILLLCSIYFIAAEGSKYWTIDHYDIKAVMDEDSFLYVEEKITANFRGQYHGILRTIPATYDISNIKCSDPFVVETDNDELIIRIGSPDTLITGSVEYELTYVMDPRLKYEFVYNIPGTWSVDVFDLTFFLSIPKDKFYECSMAIKDLLPTGKTFETTEDAEGNLIIKASASKIPAYGHIELILR